MGVLSKSYGDLAGRLTQIGEKQIAEALQIIGKCDAPDYSSAPLTIEYETPLTASPEHGALNVVVPEGKTAAYFDGNVLFTGQLVNLATQKNPPIPLGIRFRNRSGGTIPRYAIMKVTGAAILGGLFHLTVSQPDNTFCRSYVVNGNSDVYDNEFGYCTGLGLGTALVTGSPAVGASLGATSGSWSLVVNRPGFTVLGNVSTTPNAYLVEQYEVNSLLGKIVNATLSQGSSTTVDVYMGTPNSEALTEYKNANSTAITGYDYLMKTGATAIAVGKKVILTYVNSAWYVTEAECP